MSGLLKKLEGGDRRSIGRVRAVVAEVLADPSLFGDLFAGMLHADPLIRMRAADAVEKITARHPEYLHPYKTKLIEQVASIEQQEVRWHVAQLFSRLDLDEAERRTVVAILSEYLLDNSKIVKTFSMQALADIGGQDDELRSLIIGKLEAATRTGSPAMKSRGGKLLGKLKG